MRVCISRTQCNTM